MTVPIPGDGFRTGVVDSSDLNGILVDPLNFLLNPPRFRLLQTSAQTFTTAVAAAIQFNAETYDTDVDGTGGHDNATNNTRYTARYPGHYQFGGGITFAANATGVRVLYWSVNGSALNGSLVELAAVTGGVVTAVAARLEQYYLNVGDYVELFALQTSGGNLNSSVTTVDQPSMVGAWKGI